MCSLFRYCVCLLACLFVSSFVFLLCSFVRLRARRFACFVCFVRSCACVSACLFVCLCACLFSSLRLLVCVFNCLFVCYIVCLLGWLFACLFVCLSARLCEGVFVRSCV